GALVLVPEALWTLLPTRLPITQTTGRYGVRCGQPGRIAGVDTEGVVTRRERIAEVGGLQCPRARPPSPDELVRVELAGDAQHAREVRHETARDRSRPADRSRGRRGGIRHGGRHRGGRRV